MTPPRRCDLTKSMQKSLESWELIKSLLPDGWEQKAFETGALRPQYPDTKIKTAEQLLRLLLLHSAVGMPLRQAVELFAQATDIHISHKTLHQRLRKAGPYLHWLIQELAGTANASSAEQWAGYDVLVADATVVTRPGSCGTDARLHTLIRLSTLECISVKESDVTVGETLRNFTFASGQLVIADRGYCTGRGFASAVDEGADLLVRLNRGSLRLLDSNGDEINVMAVARELQGNRVEEHAVRAVVDSGRVIPGRLIMKRLPKEKAAQARKRVLAELGREASAETLEASEYVLLFTTATRLSAAQCIDLYPLRWQLELTFKRWKSLCSLDALPKFRDDTIKAWLYTKILAALLLERIGSQHGELSPPVHTGTNTGRSAALEASLDPVAALVLRHYPYRPDASGWAPWHAH